jgi:hypothetical protein
VGGCALCDAVSEKSALDPWGGVHCVSRGGRAPGWLRACKAREGRVEEQMIDRVLACQ